MSAIAEEAERQGFQVRQTRATTWHFRRENANWMFAIKQPEDVLDVVGVLVADAGLHWPAWDK